MALIGSLANLAAQGLCLGGGLAVALHLADAIAYRWKRGKR